MASFDGFVGPSYASQSPNLDAEAAINCYVERAESPNAKARMALYQTPGLALFATLLSGNSIRGQIVINGRAFAACGTNLYEVLSTGLFSVMSPYTIANDNLPVSFAAGPTQFVIASAGVPYVYDLTANTLTQIDPSTLAGVAMVDYMDGFFIALLQNSNQYQLSNLLDGSTWNPLNKKAISVFPGNVLSIKVDHRQLWLFGNNATTVDYDSGAALFPFDTDQSAGVIEQGISAPFSVAKLDNSLFWLGSDSRGSGIVWRAAGFTPIRISNHALEFAMQGYSTITDAIAYAYQDQGHSFYVLYFPTANVTWVFDSSVNMWHQRAFWNSAIGQYTAHRSQNHIFCFGKHLVGDWASGNIYSMSITSLTDFGNPIRRVRRAPHISNEMQWMFHHEFQIDIEPGLGPQPPLAGPGIAPNNVRGPELVLRWSDNGGKTWSNDHVVDCGQAGKFRTRAIWRRLGRSRDRIYELEYSDPAPFRIVNAYLKAS